MLEAAGSWAGLTGKRAARIKGNALDAAFKTMIEEGQAAGQLSKRWRTTARGLWGPDVFWSHLDRPFKKGTDFWVDITTAAERAKAYNPMPYPGKYIKYGRPGSIWPY
jgi:hypothetical protein